MMPPARPKPELNGPLSAELPLIVLLVIVRVPVHETAPPSAPAPVCMNPFPAVFRAALTPKVLASIVVVPLQDTPPPLATWSSVVTVAVFRSIITLASASVPALAHAPAERHPRPAVDRDAREGERDAGHDLEHPIGEVTVDDGGGSARPGQGQIVGHVEIARGGGILAGAGQGEDVAPGWKVDRIGAG